MTPPTGDGADLVVELAIARLGGEMQKSFAEVNGKLDLLTADGVRHSGEIAALEVRVSQLERRVWAASGVAALLGMAVPFIAQLLGGG